MRTWHEFYVAMFGIFGMLSFVAALTLYSEVKHWKNRFFDTFNDVTYWRDKYYETFDDNDIWCD